MPKPVKKPRERRWGNPHRVIEKTARKDWLTGREVLEAGWFKRPRGKLEDATTLRTAKYIFMRKPCKGDTMHIHTHPAEPGCLLMAMPTVEDLKTACQNFENHGVRISVITRVETMGKEIGRTFIKMRKTEGKEFAYLLQKYGEYEKEEKLRESLEILETMQQKGFLSIRFVPMKGYRFNRKIGDFVRIRGKKGKSKREGK